MSITTVDHLPQSRFHRRPDHPEILHLKTLHQQHELLVECIVIAIGRPIAVLVVERHGDANRFAAIHHEQHVEL